MAEARALAPGSGELLADGTAARDVVLLTRATTDLRVYERALEDRGIPTYVIGGRGYWAHPQVIDMVAYLRALANPRDGGGAVHGARLAAGRRLGSTRSWCSPPRLASARATPGGCCATRTARSTGLGLGIGSVWPGLPPGSPSSGRLAARAGIEELIDRVLERTGYDLAVLGMPGGRGAWRTCAS